MPINVLKRKIIIQTEKKILQNIFFILSYLLKN